MKKLFLSLVVFSILFVIGCQENTITDPLSAESSGTQGITNETAIKNITQDVPDVIRFENVLESPIPSTVNGPRECFIVAGTIEVDHKVWQLDPIPPSKQYRVTVGLCIDAEMNCAAGQERNRWFIECDTENTIYFFGDELFTLTKYYTVTGRSDRMQLVVDYGVSIDGVYLKSMALRIPKYQVDKLIRNF